MIIYFAAGKDGDPRCRAAGIEDTAQRRVSIGEKGQKKTTQNNREKEAKYNWGQMSFCFRLKKK